MYSSPFWWMFTGLRYKVITIFRVTPRDLQSKDSMKKPADLSAGL